MFESAHIDTFTRDRLPDMADWPELVFDLPELRYPERLNAADTLLNGGKPDRPAILWDGGSWTYAELRATANRIARVLTEDYGLVPGGRVLLRGRNTPMMFAAWYGALLAGGVVVSTMPLLRAGELATIIDAAEIGLALSENDLMDELTGAAKVTAKPVSTVGFGAEGATLEAHMAEKPDDFAPIQTAQDDVALLAFTSGTTGKPKACMHFHRDILAMADGYARHILAPRETDVFTGSPPIAFTFGLGGLVVFPARFGAAVALISGPPTPQALLDCITRHKVTMLFTAPTAYKTILEQLDGADISSLRVCVSAGETLPKAIFDAWFEKTGLKLMDGIGSTEMIHIFISAKAEDIRPGHTGKPVPGYRACVIDEDGNILPPPATGRLAVKGPTGCRYMADERQKNYVVNGWNVTGDTYFHDEDGYFRFVARSDDMIVSSGYNIGGPEVEAALLLHDAVAECAVVGVPDTARGQIVKAFIVPAAGVTPSADLAEALKTHVKETIAPYKYPRAIDFIDELPKTQTGKIQRFKLREG
ncbi:benzoate-CoA ligase family protein [Kordiimonas marina]|uniref:benzoate-CoA ligase family protein n=1 Tax=Kordiimonas marina TaxID=2872312 RepID=UPI001FF2EBA8|nr:benzoate-CoA ligase family protein [Kordiimonas marina]MCJ9429960.1 benzoate-CoA ligase family protein [Kordiimonas marina]